MTTVLLMMLSYVSVYVFLRFIKNGLDLNMETTRVTDLDDYSKTWLMDLLRANMKDMYEKSEWGWNEKNKAEEMFDDHAWYVPELRIFWAFC